MPVTNQIKEPQMWRIEIHCLSGWFHENVGPCMPFEAAIAAAHKVGEFAEGEPFDLITRVEIKPVDGD